MLDSLRKNVSGFVGMIFIGVIALSFAVWGIADIFTSYGSDAVAEVGDQEIPGSRFQLEYQRRLEDISDQAGTYISPAEGRNFGLDRQVLGRLIGMAALDAQVRELNLRIPDDAVAEDIYTDPSFQGPFGRFDRQTFEIVLMQNRISESMLVEDRRGFLARSQFLDAVTEGTPVPGQLAEHLYTYRNERRVAEYLVLNPDMTGDLPEPSEDDLKELHQNTPDAFSTPETRSFEVLAVRPALLADTIDITDEELRDHFEERRDEYGEPEARTFYQIPFSSDEAASAAVERLRAGEPVETVLEETGLGPNDVIQRDATRRDPLGRSVAEAAFALGENEVSDPIATPLGPAVVKVISITPGTVTDFEDVRDELRRDVALELAARDVYDIYNRIEDERAAGTSLGDISNMLGLPVQRFENITRDGTTADGAAAELPEVPQLLGTAFSLDENEEADPLETPDESFFWVNVSQINRPELMPFEDVRDEVAALWQQETQRAELIELAENIVSRGNDGEPFETITAEFGRAVLTSPPLTRNASSDTFSRFAVTNLFSTPEGKFTYGGTGYGDSVVVMRVKEVRRPDPEANADEVAELRTNLRETLADDVIGTMVSALQEKHGVRINEAALNRIIGN